MKQVIRTLSAIIFLLGILQACKKSNNNPNPPQTDYAPPFVGIYTMTSPCWASAGQVSVTRIGADTIQLPLGLYPGGVCEKDSLLIVPVTKNSITPTTFNLKDGCGIATTETLSGTLNSNNLSLTYVTSNASGSFTCVFSGSK